MADARSEALERSAWPPLTERPLSDSPGASRRSGPDTAIGFASWSSPSPLYGVVLRASSQKQLSKAAVNSSCFSRPSRRAPVNWPRIGVRVCERTTGARSRRRMPLTRTSRTSSTAGPSFGPDRAQFNKHRACLSSRRLTASGSPSVAAKCLDEQLIPETRTAFKDRHHFKSNQGESHNRGAGDFRDRFGRRRSSLRPGPRTCEDFPAGDCQRSTLTRVESGRIATGHPAGVGISGAQARHTPDTEQSGDSHA